MPPTQESKFNFWAGYRVWLGQNRRLWWTLGALALAAFVVALWASAAPEDPFAYAAFR